MVFEQILVFVLAVAFSGYCFKRARDTLAQTNEVPDTPNKVLFHRFFRWFWTILRVNWALTWLTIAVIAWIKLGWVLYGLLWFPISMLIAIIFSAVYFKVVAPAGTIGYEGKKNGPSDRA